ncbi:hypothetical protein QAD02_007619 [Eretmocerus hayati]|uniref:Uncharacterized protein n=1 Tax=Eretmocerus hayati TaxID=131215 RepID=A0ACC2N467_9HYME|nr:hypothetical protein QAD02_007619 [Eretmocerus hayati]
MGREHIIHFMSVDLRPSTDICQQLLDLGMMNLDDLKTQDPEVGDVVKSELESGRLILFAFIKEKYDDIPSVSTVCLCLTHLRDALLNHRIGTVSLAERGGGLDDIPWAPIEDTIRTH